MFLEINQNGDKNITPNKIKTTLGNWRDFEMGCAFVDFETIGDIFDPLRINNVPNQYSYNVVFMIGLYYKNIENGTWSYKEFTCKIMSRKEEYKIFQDFIQHLTHHRIQKLWYWHAEQTFVRQTIKIHPSLKNLNKYEWLDMCKLFKTEPIIVKGMFDFGLKSVVKSYEQQ